MIHWADEKFLYYVKKQPLAKKPKLYGMAYARFYAKGWFKHVFAYLIGAGLLFAMIFVVGCTRGPGLWSGPFPNGRLSSELTS